MLASSGRSGARRPKADGSEQPVGFTYSIFLQIGRIRGSARD
jgi:hypothetical protein